MATLYGVKITGLKTFEGHEGPCAQGNISYNGKKIGFWSTDPWGGQDNIDFPIETIKPALDAYFEKVKNESIGYGSKTTVGGLYTSNGKRNYCEFIGLFMGALLNLMEDEKRYKKGLKKGYNVLVISHEGKVNLEHPCAVPLTYTTSFDSPCNYSSYFMQKGLYEEPVIEKVYESVNDFDVSD